MLIAYESHASRNVKLFVNSCVHELNSNTIQYDLSHIYDLLLIDKPNIIILDNIHNNIYEQLSADIKAGYVSDIDTKFIILGPKNNTDPALINAKYIDNKAFKPYNEYTEKQISENFIFGILNCDNVLLNNKLHNLLYPNNVGMPIRLVNCPEYVSPHNLGVADEETCLRLLSKCEIFINTNNTYLYDAIFLQKKIISIIDNPVVPVVDDISLESIKDIIPMDPSFLNQHKISTLVKHIINK